MTDLAGEINTVAFKNGAVFSPANLNERAFVYGDGVFETIFVCNSKLPLWDYHRSRLEQSAARLKLQISIPKIESYIDSILKAQLDPVSDILPDASPQGYILKLIVGRGGESRGSYPVTNEECDYYFLLRKFASPYQGASADLITVDEPLVVNKNYAGLKLLNRLDYIVPTAGMTVPLRHEALFCDPQGVVLETMHHNLFMVKDGVVHTSSGAGVHGVLRAFLIQKILPSVNLPLVESAFNLGQLKGADGVFITNALDGVVPVNSVDAEVLAQSESVGRVADAVFKVMHE